MSSSSSTDKCKLRILHGGSWQWNSQDWEYVTDQPMVKTLVPSHVTYSRFRIGILRKCGINPECQVSILGYKYNGVLYELGEYNISDFLRAAAGVAATEVPILCVYDDATKPDLVNDAGTQTVCEPDGRQPSDTSCYIPQFDSHYNYLYEGASDFLSGEGCGVTDRYAEYVPETQEAVAEEEVEEENDGEECVYHIPGVDSNEDDTDEEASSPTRFSGGLNDFFGQPPPLPDKEPELTYNVVPVPYNRSNRVNMLDDFPTKKALTVALGRKFLEEGFEFRVERSSRTRYEAVCKHDNCDWRIYATVVKDTDIFHVRKLHDVHTCSRTQMHPNHHNANRKVLGDVIMPKVMDESRKLRARDIVNDVKEQLNIDISYWQAWRAKAYAISMIKGDPHESFTRLPAFMYNLELQNPGSYTRIKTDGRDRFENCFLALGCAVRSNKF